MSGFEEVQVPPPGPVKSASVTAMRAERAHYLSELKVIDAQIADINRRRASRDPLYSKPEYVQQRINLVQQADALRAKAGGLKIKIKAASDEVEDELMFTQFSFRKDPRKMGNAELRAMLSAQQSVVSHMESAAKQERSYLAALTRAAERVGLIPYLDDLDLAALPN